MEYRCIRGPVDGLVISFHVDPEVGAKVELAILKRVARYPRWKGTSFQYWALASGKLQADQVTVYEAEPDQQLVHVGSRPKQDAKC